MAIAVHHEFAKTGSTGTGTFTPLTGGLAGAKRLAVVVNVTAIGAGPTATYTVEGSIDGTNNWYTLAQVAPDSTTAVSNAAITVTTVSQTVRYIDGLDKRFFDAIRLNVSANTNVTFNAKLYRDDH